jgi:hypothetical protein
LCCQTAKEFGILAGHFGGPGLVVLEEVIELHIFLSMVAMNAGLEKSTGAPASRLP